uniref:Uncharacterized protein n=1 Tax=Arundo donax TaxID=35708 RepID=A0A0A9D1N1_ARUDO
MIYLGTEAFLFPEHQDMQGSLSQVQIGSGSDVHHSVPTTLLSHWKKEDILQN